MRYYIPDIAISGKAFFVDNITNAEVTDIPASVTLVTIGGYYSNGDCASALYKKVLVEPTHNAKFQSNDGAWWEFASEVIGPSQIGAKGDNIVNDQPDFQDAVEFSELSAGYVKVKKGSYKINSFPTARHNWGFYGIQPSIVPDPSLVEFDGGGSTFYCAQDNNLIEGGNFWSAWGTALSTTGGVYPPITGIITANVATGDVSFTLSAADAAKFAINNSVLIQLGEVPNDTPECMCWYFCKIIGKPDATTLITDMPSPYPVNIAAMTDPYGKSHRVSLWPIFENQTWKNFNVYPQTGASLQPIKFEGAKHLTLQNVVIGNNKLHPMMQYVEDCEFKNVTVKEMDFTVGNGGKAFHFAETRRMKLTNCRAYSTKWGISAEANSTVDVDGFVFYNNAKNGGVPRTDIEIFNAVCGTTINARNVSVIGYGAFVLTNEQAPVAYTVANQSSIDITNIKMDITSEVKTFDPKCIHGIMDYRVAGSREVWDFDKPVTWKKRIYLTNGMLTNFLGPVGIVQELKVFASSGLAGKIGAGLTFDRCYIGRNPNYYLYNLCTTTANTYFGGPITAGYEVDFPVVCGTTAGDMWAQRNAQVLIRIGTLAGTDLPGTDYIEVECTIIQKQQRRYTATQPWDNNDRNPTN